jgi:rubrerythrin
MDLGAIFLLLAVLILIVLFVASPFSGRERALTGGEQTLSALLAERDRLLSALQELDFDYSLGKIPAEEYPAQRKELVQSGAGILRRLDELQGKTGKSAEDRIEAIVAARRRDAPVASDEDLEDLIAKRRSIRKDKAAGFCPKCGKPILQSDVFCPSCGRALK